MVEDLAASYVALKLENEILQAQVKRLVEENAALQAQIPELQKSGAANEDKSLRKSSEAQKSPESPELLEPPAARASQKPWEPSEITELGRPPEIKEARELSAIREPRGCPEIKEPRDPSVIRELMGLPEIKESQKPPETKEPQKPPEIKEPQKPPETKEPQKPPEIKEPQKPPETKEPQKPPEIKEPQKPPEIKEPQKPPEIKEPVGPSVITEFRGSPEIKEPCPPPKFKENWEPQEPPEVDESWEPPGTLESTTAWGLQEPTKAKEAHSPSEFQELSAWKPPAGKEPQEIQKALEYPATQKPQDYDLPAVWDAGPTDTQGTPGTKELQNSQLHNPTNDEESQKVPEYQETSSQLEPLEYPTTQEPLEPQVPQEPLEPSDAEEFLELSVPEESLEGLIVVETATASAFPQANSRLDAVALPLEDPLSFNGDSQKLSEFLVQLNSYLRTRGYLYPTEAALISFVGSFFSGEAGRLFQSLADIQSPLLEQFERFFRVLQDTFDNPESMEAANHGLPQLRQGEGLVHRYATRFHLIAQELNLDESTFPIQYQEELASSIQNELSCTSPATNLSDVIIECVTLEEKTDGKANSDSSSSEEENGSESPPTENQAVQATSNRPHLSEAERARRREGHLCLYCGHPGHFARDCPVKPHRAQQAGNMEARR
ncbi:retrotransposon Gag-like protein 3 [Mesocricetus auratus]|uniref:Retrotransposon Gag-like protein 3 n=1 Tax=Mesocricetus auratus TaxID=10036 RepID=A0ABM2XBR5_MESAU|nr:retrotransposon Gag-like protein 3 [Mesocricetus auratus]